MLIFIFLLSVTARQLNKPNVCILIIKEEMYIARQSAPSSRCVYILCIVLDYNYYNIPSSSLLCSLLLASRFYMCIIIGSQQRRAPDLKVTRKGRSTKVSLQQETAQLHSFPSVSQLRSPSGL